MSDTGAGRAQLLADAPVDAPAEQIGVPVKARVLLDHVHQQPAQPDRLALGRPRFAGTRTRPGPGTYPCSCRTRCPVSQRGGGWPY